MQLDQEITFLLHNRDNTSNKGNPYIQVYLDGKVVEYRRLILNQYTPWNRVRNPACFYETEGIYFRIHNPYSNSIIKYETTGLK